MLGEAKCDLRWLLEIFAQNWLLVGVHREIIGREVTNNTRIGGKPLRFGLQKVPDILSLLEGRKTNAARHKLHLSPGTRALIC